VRCHRCGQPSGDDRRRRLSVDWRIPDSCGCPGKKEATKCDFFCGSVPKNEDVIVHIPNGVELTCREIDAMNRAGRISEGVCPTIAAVLDPCGCAGSSDSCTIQRAC
jgi:hypothetical protein